MPPTDDKGRFVAIKLGLPSERCAGGYNTTWYDHWVCCKHGSDYPHDLLPDFLSPAGADLLLRALLARYVVEIFIQDENEYAVRLTRHGGASRNWDDEDGIGATWPEALLDAAFKALEEK